MLFVCVAHFSGAYLAPRGADAAELLAIVSMIASPMFMLISGATTGFLAQLRPRWLPHLRRRLLDRGVFMLLVGHLVLALAAVEHQRGLAAAYRLSFITDPIAIAIMIGPSLVGRVTAARRILLSLALYVFGWTLVLFWYPNAVFAVSLKPYLAGTIGSASGANTLTFPLLQWLAVYVFGTVLGERVGRAFPNGSASARQPFLRAGMASIAVGLALYFSAKILPQLKGIGFRVLMAGHLTTPTQKFPPAPAYLLFFGGCGLVVMWLVLKLEDEGRFALPMTLLQRIGQSSLVIYLLQAFVYSTIVRRVTAPYTHWWPLLFIASIAPLLVSATFWCRIDGNRFLTVGITAMLESRSGGSGERPTIHQRVARPAG